jgi:hypothetical protein
MEAQTKIELVIKIIGPIITVTGILIGVWQFNKGQRNMQIKELEQRQFELKKMQIGNQFEAIAKFKELQSKKYTEATEVISNIIYTDNYQSDDFKKSLRRFWQLYWVELSAVEDSQVETAMVRLGNHIELLSAKDFQNVTESEKKELHSLGYSVAQAIKSSSKTWELPEGFEN